MSTDADLTRESEDIRLSDDAQMALLEAAKRLSGTIECHHLDQGTSISTDRKTFSIVGNRESEAHWKAVVEELVTAGCIRDRGHRGVVYELTDVGYEMVAIIQQERKT